MKIGLDIDGVIIDFERTMRTYAELYDLLILKKDGVKYKNQFDYLKRYDWSDNEKKDFVNKYLIYATTYSTPLIPLVKEMLEFIKIEGHDFLFITKRGIIKKESKEAIIDLFNNNDIPASNIYWEVEDKVFICKNLGIDIMIEDNPIICKQLRDNKIKTLYYREKDNEIIPDSEYLKEVANVGEICRYIINLNGFNNSKEKYEQILLKKKIH